jgi:hypothetical protein
MTYLWIWRISHKVLKSTKSDARMELISLDALDYRIFSPTEAIIESLNIHVDPTVFIRNSIAFHGTRVPGMSCYVPPRCDPRSTGNQKAIEPLEGSVCHVLKALVLQNNRKSTFRCGWTHVHSVPAHARESRVGCKCPSRKRARAQQILLMKRHKLILVTNNPKTTGRLTVREWIRSYFIQFGLGFNFDTILFLAVHH